MAAARLATAEKGTPLEGAGTRMSGGTIAGRVVGVIVGVVAGFVAGCVMGILYLCAITGPAGAILGGIAGYRAGGGKFGCAGGCLAIIVGFLFIIVIITILS